MSEYEEFAWSYTEGVVNKSITISLAAQQLLDNNEIKNTSKFINSLIIEALQDSNYFKRQHMAAITVHRQKLEKITGKKYNLIEEGREL